MKKNNNINVAEYITNIFVDSNDSINNILELKPTIKIVGSVVYATWSIEPDTSVIWHTVNNELGRWDKKLYEYSGPYEPVTSIDILMDEVQNYKNMRRTSTIKEVVLKVTKLTMLLNDRQIESIVKRYNNTLRFFTDWLSQKSIGDATDVKYQELINNFKAKKVYAIY